MQPITRKVQPAAENRRIPGTPVNFCEAVVFGIHRPAAVLDKVHSGTTITFHGLWKDTIRAASEDSTNTQTSDAENCGK